MVSTSKFKSMLPSRHAIHLMVLQNSPMQVVYLQLIFQLGNATAVPYGLQYKPVIKIVEIQFDCVLYKLESICSVPSTL